MNVRSLTFQMFKFNFFDAENQQKVDEEQPTEQIRPEFGEIDLDRLSEFQSDAKERIHQQIASTHSDLIPAVYEGLTTTGDKRGT